MKTRIQDVVVVVEGGVIQHIAVSSNDLRVTVINWDELEESPGAACA